MMEPDLKLMDEKVRLAYRVARAARDARDPRDARDGRDASNSQAGLPCEPPTAIDDAIRAAARRAVAAKPVSIQKTLPPKWNKQWTTPLAAAATVLLTASILFVALDEHPDVLEAPSQVSPSSAGRQGPPKTSAPLPTTARQQATVLVDRMTEKQASQLAKSDVKNMTLASQPAVTGRASNPAPATAAASADALPERRAIVQAAQTAQIVASPPMKSPRAESAVNALASAPAPSLALSSSAPSSAAPQPASALTVTDTTRLDAQRPGTPSPEERRRAADSGAVASVGIAPVTPKTAASQPIERAPASSAELSLTPAKPKFDIAAAKKSTGPAVGKIATNNLDGNSTANQTAQKFESSGNAASELKLAKENAEERVEAADLWIARLTELNQQNKIMELTEELKRFRKRYPTVELPKPLAEAWAKIVIE